MDEYPPTPHLIFWWQCQRKRAHQTEAEARALSAQYDLTMDAYRCRFGDHWHNGKQAGPNTTFGPYMLRKQWRKRIKKPTPEALMAAYEAARESYPEGNYWKAGTPSERAR